MIGSFIGAISSPLTITFTTIASTYKPIDISLLLSKEVLMWYGCLTLISALQMGLVSGMACIKHLILRIILYFNRSIPWNYAAFLNYASDRILLRKVGGGYIFVHRALQEHFAQL
jgi:hypothetical protein